MTNKNYKAAKYTVEIEIPKSPDDVFNHVIDLAKWWPEEFEGESIKLDTEFVFRTGDSHYSKNKVIEFAPNKKSHGLQLKAYAKQTTLTGQEQK